MLTKETLDACITQAIKLRLAGYELLLTHSDEQILKIANGIGPASWSPKLCGFIDRFNPALLVASVIHDLRYCYGTGTRADFLQANADLEINTQLVAEDTYGWYNPTRYWTTFKGHEARKACDKFGWSAYCNAISERTKDPFLQGSGLPPAVSTS